MATNNSFPKDLRYSESHEWVKLSTNKTNKKHILTIGITVYAIEKLGDLIHLELPAVGEKIEQGNSFGEIESVKTVAELYSPVSGKVTEVNEDVKENLELLKDDSYEDGWLIKVEIKDIPEIDYLMDSEAYDDYLKSLEPNEETNDSAGEDEDFFM